MSIAVWLVALVPGLVARVLMALGFGIVTFTGFALATSALKDLIVSNLTGAPIAIVQLAGLAGVGVGLGIVFGAITFRLAYFQLSAATKMVMK